MIKHGFGIVWLRAWPLRNLSSLSFPLPIGALSQKIFFFWFGLFLPLNELIQSSSVAATAAVGCLDFLFFDKGVGGVQILHVFLKVLVSSCMNLKFSPKLSSTPTQPIIFHGALICSFAWN